MILYKGLSVFLKKIKEFEVVVFYLYKKTCDYLKFLRSFFISCSISVSTNPFLFLSLILDFLFFKKIKNKKLFHPFYRSEPLKIIYKLYLFFFGLTTRDWSYVHGDVVYSKKNTG